MTPSVLLNPSDQPAMKILGLKWDPAADTFSFDIHPNATAPTKRSVLSEIAKVFDPIGLLAPITFWTKHIMQRLWTSGLEWDDPVPADIAALWDRYLLDLPLLKKLSIPRRLTYDNSITLQLHAFSDSSVKGYAAAIYLRIETNTAVHCHLISGKSKVAPLKRYTIPRPELCGALLAAKLLNLIVHTYSNKIKIDATYAWTDSTTALAWIRSSPHRWPTFIANRTSQIQELTSPSIWRHVLTKFNPADCASRGLLPADLVDHPLWWTGAPFLTEPPIHWPPPLTLHEDYDDAQNNCEVNPSATLLVKTDVTSTLIDKFSSLIKIMRILAYCLRFSRSRRPLSFSINIEASEMTNALSQLLKSTQHLAFPEDNDQLKKGAPCSPKIQGLDPFLDDAGLIRVGGRLKHADLPYAQKHPILLPSNHRLTALIIDHHYYQLQHTGSFALQSHLQQLYWILSARRVIRSRLKSCIACYRLKPRSFAPKMGDLPKLRVQQIKPFTATGVDYAGPIKLKSTRGHRAQSSAYICLFVCFSTKAIHLELSSDLSTETFLLAFNRFSARRGPIKSMHSDCGTNFVGAARLLSPLQKLTHSVPFQTRIKTSLAAKQISWHFNPPSSPHFGGLWEAGVKSTKALLLRSVGNQTLSSEELNTLLVQIEATLNSRPLCALSHDPTDLTALTPSHFLTLEPPTSPPEPCLLSIPLSKMQRWRLINDIYRHFWSRWKNDYLSTLQLRRKWTTPNTPLQVGDLVLIHEHTPPLHWRLARVQQLHPGPDGISRTATVVTSTGQLLRPVIKLCPLPLS